MPAYNGETFLEQAIESVLAQTHENWELIVVDDGSTDNTANIVAAFKDPRIRYTYQENQGQAAALNRGLDLAQGEYVTTLDTDDWYTPESLAERVRFLEQFPEFGVVYGDGYYCDVTGKPLRRFSEYRIGDVTGDVYDILITTPFFGTGANVMVRREVYEEYQIRYDESIVWCQDYDIYIRMAEKVRFGLVETITLWYRLHEANMTTSMPMGHRLESYIRTKLKVLASLRFESVSTPLKINFFFQLLTVDLRGRFEEQMTVVETPRFQMLPRQQQARLMRLMANNCLLDRNHLEDAKIWLERAWSLAPSDLKIIVAIFLVYLHPGWSRRVMKWWRLNSSKGSRYASPPFGTTEGG